MAVFAAATVSALSQGGWPMVFFAAAYALIWWNLLTTVVLDAEVGLDEVVLRTPLRTDRVPVGEIAKPGRWYGYLRRRGTARFWTLPWGPQRVAFLDAIERVRGSSTGTL